MYTPRQSIAVSTKSCPYDGIPFLSALRPNYNMVELGPRGTGKSHLYQQISPYAHLISGGKAAVAKMFVNNANGQRG